jgi:hypothetical protein
MGKKCHRTEWGAENASSRRHAVDGQPGLAAYEPSSNPGKDDQDRIFKHAPPPSPATIINAAPAGRVENCRPLALRATAATLGTVENTPNIQRRAAGSLNVDQILNATRKPNSSNEVIARRNPVQNAPPPPDII